MLKQKLRYIYPYLTRKSYQFLQPVAFYSTQSFNSESHETPSENFKPSENFREEAKVFEKIVLSRRRTLHFKPDPIPQEILSHILALAQRAPTGYNLQPWCAIVVDNEEQKMKLYEASLKQQKILEAPITIVFGSSHNPLVNREKILDMSLKAGILNEEYKKQIKMNSDWYLSSHGIPCNIARIAKRVIGRGVSLFKPMLVPQSNVKAYSWKQTMPAVTTLMLAATAHGISSCPMEGFDEFRVRDIVGLPKNYSVPCIVSLGYAEEDPNRKLSLRLNPEDVYSKNEFGKKMEDVMSFNPPINESNEENIEMNNEEKNKN